MKGSSARNIEQIAESMRAGGWNGPPIKVFEHNGVKYVLDGHHRLAAARQVGLAEVPYESVPASQLGQYGYQSVDDLLRAASEAFGR
jgi:ParB-like chromosome segregation protein Spo0J